MQVRITFQGAYAISDWTKTGYYIEKQYMGYSKKTAIALFKKYLKELSY